MLVLHDVLSIALATARTPKEGVWILLFFAWNEIDEVTQLHEVLACFGAKRNGRMVENHVGVMNDISLLVP